LFLDDLLDLVKFSFSYAVGGINGLAMLGDFTDHIVTGSFSDIARFIKSRFGSGSKAFYQDRLWILYVGTHGRGRELVLG
jgi:hypothetical protein